VAAREEAAMEFRVLGPLEARREGRQLPLGGSKQRALLATLLVHANEVLSSDRLIDVLWGERPPASAAKALHVYVSQLRKLFDPTRATGTREGLLVTASSGYMLRLENEELDLQRFMRLREEARQALADDEPAEAGRLLRDALELWRGAALADLANEPFARDEAARLEELRLSTFEARIEADLRVGRHADLVGELEALVADHPFRESLRGRLMLALYRSGRQAEALDTYQDARRALVDELGIEPGRPLRELHQAILRQDPSLELASVHPPEAVAARGSGTLVGRAGELALLRSALDEAMRGRGGLYLLVGEPGIGKSRLAAELAELAQARGADVLVGRCWEAGGAPAYWPWIQSLRSYVQGRDAEQLRHELGPGAPDVAQLLPEIHRLIPDLPAVENTGSEGDRFRLFDGVTSFIKAATRTRPLLFVLDDLHAADEPTLLLLRFLTRELTDSRVLVLGAYRDVDPTLSDPLAETLAELIREPVTHRMVLHGFDESGVAEYVRLAAGTVPDDNFVGAIHAGTEGNPLFVGEVVRLLVAEGQFEGGGLPKHTVPEGVREVIGRRLRHLSPELQRVLSLASVLGREIDLSAVGQLSGTSRPDLTELLDEAITARILSELPGSPGRLRFSHVMIRDVLYDELSSVRRADLHRLVGEALEEAYAADLGPHLSELAHHYFEAAASGDARKALSYCRRAADSSLAMLAYEEAARLYRMALLLTHDGRARCDLLLALGVAEMRAGDTPSAKRSFREAADLAELVGEPEQLARAALGYGGRFTWDASRDDEALLPLLEHALEILGDGHSTLRARLLARLSAGPLRDLRYSPERRAQMRREALDLARETGDPATIAYALNGYVISEGSPAFTRERFEMGGELVAVARSIGDKEVAMEAHSDLLNDLIELGDMDGALRELAAMQEIAEELRQPGQHWFVTIFRAQIALLQGRFAEAEHLIVDALDLGERSQKWNATVAYCLQLYLLRREQGRLSEVEQLVHESLAAYPTYAVWRPIRVRMLVELGHDDEAREAFDTLAVDGFAGIPLDEHFLVSMGLLAETAYVRRDAERAARLSELLLPYADRIAVSFSEISIGSIARYLGLLAATLEDPDEAVRRFEEALIVNGRAGAAPWVAHTEIDLAHTLLLRARNGDEVRAHELLRTARATCAELGMSAGDIRRPQVSDTD
jgi:DNA-binding SARP family transcriptional activator